MITLGPLYDHLQIDMVSAQPPTEEQREAPLRRPQYMLVRVEVMPYVLCASDAGLRFGLHRAYIPLTSGLHSTYIGLTFDLPGITNESSVPYMK